MLCATSNLGMVLSSGEGVGTRERNRRASESNAPASWIPSSSFPVSAQRQRALVNAPCNSASTQRQPHNTLPQFTLSHPLRPPLLLSLHKDPDFATSSPLICGVADADRASSYLPRESDCERSEHTLARGGAPGNKQVQSNARTQIGTGQHKNAMLLDISVDNTLQYSRFTVSQTKIGRAHV